MDVSSTRYFFLGAMNEVTLIHFILCGGEKEKFSMSIAQFNRIVPMHIQAHGSMQVHILTGLIYYWTPQHLLGCNPTDVEVFIGVTNKPLK